jgi:SM-20-related protein
MLERKREDMRAYDSDMSLLPDVDIRELAGQSMDALADALRTHGACRLQDFPDTAASAALRADLVRLREDDRFAQASVGRGAGLAHAPALRGDATLWLDDARAGAAAAEYLAALDALRIALNRRLFLGLDHVEAHYAAYPAGARYTRHRDRFRDDDARVVSLVTYLNPEWGDDDGGALRLVMDAGETDVAPTRGSVCFLSELEHEVLPATRDRYSIAAWLRRRPSTR